MNEKLIERKLKGAVEALGGQAIKLVSPHFTGMPDRMILMPAGRMWFVETKTTGERLSPRQKIVIPMLRTLGFDVWVIDDQATLSEFLNRIAK